MKSQRTYHSETPFRDLLFNVLLTLLFLLFMSIFLITEQSQNSPIELQAEYIITLSWDDHSKDDIDIWMQDPLGNVLFFRGTPAGMMHLDRDDKGTDQDKMILPNGKMVTYEHNREVVTIRGVVPGEWILNVHMYRKNDKTPTGVQVKIDKVNPVLRTVFLEKFIMDLYWEEITVTRFQMDGKGEIYESGKLFKRLIKSKSKGTID